MSVMIHTQVTPKVNQVWRVQAFCKKPWGVGSIGGWWTPRGDHLASSACGPAEPSLSLVRLNPHTQGSYQAETIQHRKDSHDGVHLGCLCSRCVIEGFQHLALWSLWASGLHWITLEKNMLGMRETVWMEMEYACTFCRLKLREHETAVHTSGA